MTTRVWLVRHGEPSDEVRGRCYGSLDIGLSATGRLQMERVGNRLKSESLTAIYTSPQARALESAGILASFHGCSYEKESDLREISFGDFEGMTYSEIAARYPALYRQWMDTPAAVQFPNGESFTELRVRVLRAFDAIRRTREGQTIAIVAHGGVIRILLAWALEMPDHCLFRLTQDYAAMNLLKCVDGLPIVESVNVSAF